MNKKQGFVRPLVLAIVVLVVSGVVGVLYFQNKKVEVIQEPEVVNEPVVATTETLKGLEDLATEARIAITKDLAQNMSAYPLDPEQIYFTLGPVDLNGDGLNEYFVSNINGGEMNAADQCLEVNYLYQKKPDGWREIGIGDYMGCTLSVASTTTNGYKDITLDHMKFSYNTTTQKYELAK